MKEFHSSYSLISTANPQMKYQQHYRAAHLFKYQGNITVDWEDCSDLAGYRNTWFQGYLK